jgi:hypothetical protein
MAVVVLAAISLAGCLDMETSIELSDSGSGTVTLAYRVDNRLLDLGVFDAPTDEPTVPISQRDFELAISTVAGSELERYSARRGDEVTEISAEVTFDSVDDFNALFGRNPDALVYGPEAIRLTLLRGLGSSNIDRDLVESQFSGYTLRFYLSLEDRIESVSHGSIEDGGTSAELVMDVADAVLSRDDLVWRIER